MGDSAEAASETNDLFRILVATDCHLGYMEKDEIRRDDSFAAFEEICKIAQQRAVDFILLGGDLFHENKPSRTTLVRTIEILRRYCLNDKPVHFQVVSDQTVNFPTVFGRVNYEDPNFNVGVPVFTIHGNHDDPAGVDNLSAIDILASCNLVNYFGKTVLGGSGVGQITLHPILLSKGTTRIALYGLGNIRDERLNRMFQTPHGVRWVRPEPQEDCSTSDWFNIFVLHQNRVKSNPKNAINEHFLARFLDFVVWGHEHECLADPQEVPGMGFHISQPGSSVATSLIDGEAKPKHVLLLEVKGNQYRPTKVPLRSVRPFEYADVSLKDEPDLDPNDQVAVLEFLDRQVHRLIEHAAAKRAPNQEAMMPLVRIRVDYTGFTTVNPQRFGQKFVGKVANPHDILLFTKAAKKRTVTAEGDGPSSEALRPEELNQQNIEALVNESNLKMEILPVHDLGVALHEFVSKDDKQAFQQCVKASLDDTQSKLLKEGEAVNIREEGVLLEKLSQLMQRRESETTSQHPSGQMARPQAPDGSQLGSAAAGRQTNGRQAATIGEARAGDGPGLRSGGGSPAASIDLDDEDDLANARKAVGGLGASQRGPSPTPTSGRGRGRGRGQAAASTRGLKQATLNLTPRQRPSQRAAAAAAASAMHSAEKEERNEDAIASDSDSDAAKELEGEAMEGAESEEEPMTSLQGGRGRGRKRATPASQRGFRGASAKRGRGGTTPSTPQRAFVADDEEDDEDEPNTLTGRTGLRMSGTASQSPRRASQTGRKWGSLRR